MALEALGLVLEVLDGLAVVVLSPGAVARDLFPLLSHAVIADRVCDCHSHCNSQRAVCCYIYHNIMILDS